MRAQVQGSSNLLKFLLLLFPLERVVLFYLFTVVRPELVNHRHFLDV